MCEIRCHPTFHARETAGRTSSYLSYRSCDHRVGVLAARSGHDDVVDVVVVEGALRRGDGVVTSDDDHIRRVADGSRSRLRAEHV